MLRAAIDDLHQLPKFRDCTTFIYLEHARIDRHQASVSFWTEAGETPLPAAASCCLLLGPGCVITHDAVVALADNNCLAVWCGEEGVRFYAHGLGGTQSAARLQQQARLASQPDLRLQVVRRMYAIRFEEVPPAHYTIEQLRGMEGYRVRDAYQRLSREYGVEWHGRSYDRRQWSAGDGPNQALSAANACLYGLCHAAIVAAGYSAGLGYIHTGSQRSFVLDIADLDKCEVTIPVAFIIAAEPPADGNVARATRLACRDLFREVKLLERILPDIERLMGPLDADDERAAEEIDADPGEPLPLWTPPPGTETDPAPEA